MHAMHSAMWTLCVLALFVVYADAGVKDGFCVCQASGMYHYQTFDDAFIRFDGLCYFQLSKTKMNADRQFSINILNERKGKIFARTVQIDVENQLVTLKTGNKVIVNGKPVSLPFYKGGINISVKKNVLKVYLAWMLTILFDGKLKVTIKVPANFVGNLIGLCGDCNDNTADDFRLKGTKFSLTKNAITESRIGLSYMETGGKLIRKCPVITVNNSCTASEKCALMSDDSFKSCRNVIGTTSISNLIASCYVDVCMGIDMCVAFESLANECMAQEVSVKWKAFIGCEDPCLNKPCKNNGTCNSTNMNGKFKCSCGNKYTGNTCEIAIKDCVCRAFGDPHYITFDGQLIHFMGKCKYTLAATKSSSKLTKFSVEVKNDHRGNTRVSYTRLVDLKINGNTFRMLPGGKLKVNGHLMVLPLTNYSKVDAMFSLGWVAIWTDFGLKVEFDGAHRVIVTVPSKYMGQLTGICGDCNMKKDDYKTKFGNDVSSSKNKFSLIGGSYQVVDDSDKPETNCTVVDYVASCTDDETNACNTLIDKNGEFRKCLTKVLNTTAIIYFEACKTDVCAHKSFPKIMKKVVCQAYEAFAKECEKMKVFTKWRTRLGCNKKCDEDQFYMFKSTLCQRNCLDLPKRCTGGYGEGCVCRAGRFIMGDTCVIPRSCGCTYNGMGVKILEHVITPDCSKKVSCYRRNHIGTSQGCAANEDCLLQSGKRVCQCSPPFKKENFKCLVPAIPEKEMTSALDKFVRVTMAKIEGTPLQKISTNRPGLCAVICRNKTKCKSFTFDEMNDECKLFSVNAVKQTLVTVNCPFQDYYQLIESKYIVIRGGTIFPCGPLTEYAVVKTLKDCRAKCNKINCKSMEYSVVNQECSISNSTGKDFEIIGDSEFVFYGNPPLNKPKPPPIVRK